MLYTITNIQLFLVYFTYPGGGGVIAPLPLSGGALGYHKSQGYLKHVIVNSQLCFFSNILLYRVLSKTITGLIENYLTYST